MNPRLSRSRGWVAEFGRICARVPGWLNSGGFCLAFLRWQCKFLGAQAQDSRANPTVDMNTGSKQKRKAGAFYVHQVGTSNVATPSDDGRRTRLRTDQLGETSTAQQVDANQASEDLRTLQAVDDIGSFSYLLGDELPIFPDDDDLAGLADDSIRVTLKEKRSDNSVSAIS